jgi:phage-Barnase-EndoU-ColicinE5/D-RelE like nuclease3
MTIEEQIEALYEFALNNLDNQYKRLDLFVINETLGAHIKGLTNIDVTEFVVTIDTYSILHTLERHGNPVKEAKRGQIGVEKQHFKEILEVILNPDVVRYETRNNRESLIFEKEMGNKYFVVKEIRRVVKKRKQSKLVLQSFYIRKNALT